jgi:AcrR family transcriptional regulator
VTGAAPPAAAGRRGEVRRKIAAAALDLFSRQGYDGTTIDAIARDAGVARRTFFLHFRSKDDVVFPDHEALVVAVGRYLDEHLDTPPVRVVCEAVRMVFASYVDDPALAIRRFELTRRVPDLRNREIAWVHRYQLVFSRYLDRRMAGDPGGALAAETAAASVVAVHNHVLRGWLAAGGGGQPMADLERALSWLEHFLGPAGLRRAGEQPGVLVAVFDDDADPADIARAIDAARRRPPSGQV